MPAAIPKREESANVHLAASLRSVLGVKFQVEAERSGRSDRKLPDIEIKYGDLTVVLEAKYDDFDAAIAAAQKRWTELNPAPDIVVAISYDPRFRTDFAAAVRASAPVEFALSGEEFADMHKSKRVGEVYDLAQALRRPYAVMGDEYHEVELAIGEIQGALGYFVGILTENVGANKRIAEKLQASTAMGKRKETLQQSAKMAGLIVFGALLFQMALADKVDSVYSPKDVFERKGIGGLIKHWKYILEEINYAAIFRIAREILLVGLKPTQISALIDAADEVQKIAQDGVDLMGNIYHRLLADAKTLGAFYTTIPAATLMSGLALNPDQWTDLDWADANSVGKLRVADPACGSGTLLVASAWQLLDNFSRAHFRKEGGRFGGEDHADPRTELGRMLLEDVIWGYDILETAVHLTAATLGLISPTTDFKQTHIYRTIIGETKAGIAVGSLEMLESTAPIFRRDVQVEHNDVLREPVPPLDACIMNPPFVRGAKGSESFKFLPDSERNQVRARMRFLGKQHNFVPDGQGPAFVALACLQRADTTFIKPGGRLATILPATAIVGMGVAWRKTREKIAKDFDLETVIVSREAGAPNFSEDTNLQECIIIARRRYANEKPSDTALFVVLHNNPPDVYTALGAMYAIRQAQKSSEVIGDLRLDEKSQATSGPGYIGQFARLPWHGRNSWHGISFANIHLAFTAEYFSRLGSLSPFMSKGKIALLPLHELAIVGSARLGIYIAGSTYEKHRVRFSTTSTNYAGYHPSHHRQRTGIGHRDSADIAESPHCYVLPIPGYEEWMDKFYAKAGRIVLNHSFGFSTARRLAALISKPVQASHYWPISLKDESEEKLKTMTLWLNSTPALLLIATRAQSTQGAKVGFSQQAALEMPVLDITKLSAAQLTATAKVFDEVAVSEGLLPLPKMDMDPQRKKIDDAFSKILGLGDLTGLRNALAVEPIITGQGIQSS